MGELLIKRTVDIVYVIVEREYLEKQEIVL